MLQALRKPQGPQQPVSIAAADLKLSRGALQPVPGLPALHAALTAALRTALHATATDAATDLGSCVDPFKRAYIHAGLRPHGGNLARTARSLQVDRSNLLRLCKRQGIAST